MSKFNEALADSEKCIEIKPDWSKGFQRKGMAQQALGQMEDAIKNYEQGMKMDPNNAQCKQMLE